MEVDQDANLIARKSLAAALARHEAAKARVAKIAAQLSKLQASANAADRRADVATKIQLGGLLLKWAAADARFAAYCSAAMRDETLSPRVYRLFAPVIEKFEVWAGDLITDSKGEPDASP